ncbi:hypothetical protein HHI36_012444 [Cryptolaemus montrouzieri]|uniref:SCP domain-containing protein n=1 Tax=Cryptolaemus montrouzieri TaxID=559131 RepID=A0ABD2NE94_9CUCU
MSNFILLSTFITVFSTFCSSMYTIYMKPSYTPYCAATVACKSICSCKTYSSCSVLSMNETIRDSILFYHNQVRQIQSVAEPQPSGMTMLQYDMQLEELSTCWAAKCSNEYSECFLTSKFSETSQSVVQLILEGGESPNTFLWMQMMKYWLDQAQSISIGTMSILPGGKEYEKVHNFAQLLSDHIQFVGCAWSLLDNLLTFVCTYGPRGPRSGETIYRIGDACSLCPRNYECDFKKPFPQLCKQIYEIAVGSTVFEETTISTSATTSYSPHSEMKTILTTPNEGSVFADDVSSLTIDTSLIYSQESSMPIQYSTIPIVSKPSISFQPFKFITVTKVLSSSRQQHFFTSPAKASQVPPVTSKLIPSPQITQLPNNSSIFHSTIFYSSSELNPPIPQPTSLVSKSPPSLFQLFPAVSTNPPTGPEIQQKSPPAMFETSSLPPLISDNLPIQPPTIFQVSKRPLPFSRATLVPPVIQSQPMSPDPVFEIFRSTTRTLFFSSSASSVPKSFLSSAIQTPPMPPPSVFEILRLTTRMEDFAPHVLIPVIGISSASSAPKSILPLAFPTPPMPPPPVFRISHLTSRRMTPKSFLPPEVQTPPMPPPILKISHLTSREMTSKPFLPPAVQTPPLPPPPVFELSHSTSKTIDEGLLPTSHFPLPNNKSSTPIFSRSPPSSLSTSEYTDVQSTSRYGENHTKTNTKKRKRKLKNKSTDDGNGSPLVIFMTVGCLFLIIGAGVLMALMYILRMNVICA